MNLINRLVDVLEQEHDLYAQLLAALEQENEALKIWDTAVIDAKVREKESISAKLKGMGEEMRVLIVQIAADMGKPLGEISLGTLAKNMENPATGKRLLELREKLLIISVKTAELNNANRSLIGNAVNITKKCVKFLNSLAGGTAETYLPGRTVDSKALPGMLLTRSY
jgi:flagellar biosynthesis/type III secretory pathway chaperone